MSLINGHVYAYECEQLQKPKQGLCISAKSAWLFWFNTERRFHGQGQLPIRGGEPPSLPRDGYLNLSMVVRLHLSEITGAVDKGPISSSLRQKVIAALKGPIPML